MPHDAPRPVRWRMSKAPVPYPEAVERMERIVAGVRAGLSPETVWLLEHPHVYTAGAGARPDELIDAGDTPVFRTGRGGRYTYHGPGQRIAYTMLDLAERGRDLHRFVAGLEAWIVATLARFGVRGERRDGRVGVWVVADDGREEKIAAIGVRVRRWVAFHGLAINRDPDLARFRGIVPCGVRDHGVTSLAAQGVDVSATELDEAMRSTFDEALGRGPTAIRP